MISALAKAEKNIKTVTASSLETLKRLLLHNETY